MAGSNAIQKIDQAPNFESMTLALAEKIKAPVANIKGFCAAVRNAFGKGATRDEDFFAALAIAAQYGLNPLRREIYIFETKGGVQPYVGVDGWIRIAQQHPQFAGYTFDEAVDAKGVPVSCTCTIHRKDWPNPVKVTERVSECYIESNPNWKSKPGRMIRNRALIQAVRVAFGITGIAYADAEEIIEVQEVTVSQPARQSASTTGRVDSMKTAMATKLAPSQDDANRPIDQEPQENAQKNDGSGTIAENAQDALGTQSAPNAGPVAAEGPESKAQAKRGGGTHPSMQGEDPQSMFTE